jgi:hypothetical protein
MYYIYICFGILYTHCILYSMYLNEFTYSIVL